MAYTEYVLVATSDVWSAADHNIYNKDNINELWPYTTLGDIAYGTSGTELSRIGIGAESKVLNVVGGIPAWATGAPGIFTAQGDMLYATGANAMARLAKGNSGQHLQLNGSVPQWKSTVPGIFTAQGDLVYASASNAADRLAIGDENNVLGLASGLPAWLPTSMIKESALIGNSGTTSAPVGTTLLDWDNTSYQDSIWHEGPNEERFTVIETGRYAAYAVLKVTPYTTSGRDRQIEIYVNNVEVREVGFDIETEWCRSGWFFLNLTAADYVTIKFSHGNDESANMTIWPWHFALARIT